MDSGTVKLTPLTVFIGNNGSGKSSLIEGLWTYQETITHGLDAAMQRWLGMEHVWNRRSRHNVTGKGTDEETYENPIRFTLRGRAFGKRFDARMKINAESGINGMLIEQEHLELAGGRVIDRDRDDVEHDGQDRKRAEPSGIVNTGESCAPYDFKLLVASWQFMCLNPAAMGLPVPQKMTRGTAMLNPDGSNLAQYLWEIRNTDVTAFAGIVEAMQTVLPYTSDFQPNITREVQRTLFVQMTEGKFKIPGWLMSTGTMRILALLAVLRKPDPAPVIVIEELENGLDPRTIHLIVDEIQAAVQSGRSQVIVTTHSPYLLDLLPLSSVVLCEREDGGEPVFHRPADDAEKVKWAKDFGPGQLYTMSRLSRRAGK